MHPGILQQQPQQYGGDDGALPGEHQGVCVGGGYRCFIPGVREAPDLWAEPHQSRNLLKLAPSLLTFCFCVLRATQLIGTAQSRARRLFPPSLSLLPYCLDFAAHRGASQQPHR